MEKMSVSVFENVSFGKLRALEIDGEPWFIGNELAWTLGYKRPKDAVAAHVGAKHKRLVRLNDIGGSAANCSGTQSDDTRRVPVAMQGKNAGGNPNVMIVDESGLYRLILHSRLKAAEEFADWVTTDVLPTIRKTGRYVTGSVVALPEVQALLADRTAEDVAKALKQYDNFVAGRARARVTRAARKAAVYWTDDQILVAIARKMSGHFCGGRFDRGTWLMYDVIENSGIPLRARQKFWQQGTGVTIPGGGRKLYSFIMTEEMPGVLASLTEYCDSRDVDIRSIVTKRQPRLTA